MVGRRGQAFVYLRSCYLRWRAESLVSSRVVSVGCWASPILCSSTFDLQLSPIWASGRRDWTARTLRARSRRWATELRRSRW